MIAEKLVELRTEKGVTQEDVAQSLSVSGKTVSKWENGTSAPDLTMLAELSKYYGVTTDSLLGLSAERKTSTKEEIKSLFTGLDRRNSVLKVFEAARAVVPALFNTLAHEDISCDTDNDINNTDSSSNYRNEISQPDIYRFDASSENVNLAVMMLRNKSNFAWMNAPDKQKEIVRIFRLLSSEDVLSVMYFIHSTACPDDFTADYISANTGVSEERTSQILDEFCAVGECSQMTVHLIEGEVKVYECFGDGIILTLISLAFERMCGNNNYDNNLSGECRLIGGK